MNKPKIELENVINNFAEDLTKFTDDIKPDDEVIGYILVKVTKTGKQVQLTECCGGHPFVVMDMCERVIKSVKDHLKEQAND